mgnify:CR=1 FL=1
MFCNRLIITIDWLWVSVVFSRQSALSTNILFLMKTFANSTGFFAQIQQDFVIFATWNVLDFVATIVLVLARERGGKSSTITKITTSPACYRTQKSSEASVSGKITISSDGGTSTDCWIRIRASWAVTLCYISCWTSIPATTVYVLLGTLGFKWCTSPTFSGTLVTKYFKSAVTFWAFVTNSVFAFTSSVFQSIFNSFLLSLSSGRDGRYGDQNKKQQNGPLHLELIFWFSEFWSKFVFQNDVEYFFSVLFSL